MFLTITRTKDSFGIHFYRPTSIKVSRSFFLVRSQTVQLLFFHHTSGAYLPNDGPISLDGSMTFNLSVREYIRDNLVLMARLELILSHTIKLNIHYYPSYSLYNKHFS